MIAPVWEDENEHTPGVAQLNIGVLLTAVVLSAGLVMGVFRFFRC